MTSFKHAYEYLRSFEADGECKVAGVDPYANTLIVENASDEFVLIVGAYMERTWGVNLAPRIPQHRDLRL